MAKLIYVTPMSFDGFIGDNEYNWSTPGEEFMASINDLMRPIGTYLYGRRNYETMQVWETPEAMPGLSQRDLEFAKVWQSAEKIVYSRTLEKLSVKKGRIERAFDPQKVRDLKAKSTQDIAIGGPNLAAQAMKAGLVDDYYFFVVPMVMGNGLRVLPENFPLKMNLVSEQKFKDGWLYLHYQPENSL